MKFLKKILRIGGIEKLSFFEGAILAIFFASSPRSQRFLGSKVRSKFWGLSWFPAKNHPHQTFLARVYIIDGPYSNVIHTFRIESLESSTFSKKSAICVSGRSGLTWSIIEFLELKWDNRRHGLEGVEFLNCPGAIRQHSSSFLWAYKIKKPF